MPQAPRSSASGARIEAPRVVGCGEGMCPSPPEGAGEGAVRALSRKIFDFDSIW